MDNNKDNLLVDDAQRPESNNVTQQTIAFKVLESSATDILTGPGGVATVHMFDLGE